MNVNVTSKPLATVSDLQSEAWLVAESKGFHDGYRGDGRDDTLLRLCLVHTEVSEAAQEVKRHWPASGSPTDAQRAEFGLEVADAVIRLLDICGCVGVDLARCIRTKMAINAIRPHRYNTAAEGVSDTETG